MMNNKRIVFHGTQNKDFKNFTNIELGLGGDPNFVLGIFFAENPHLAVDYSGNDGLVIVAAIADSPSLIVDLEHHIFNDEIIAQANLDYIENGCEPFKGAPDFNGHSDDYRVFCHFARNHYIEQGIKTLQYAHIGDDEQMCVYLNANDAEILCILTSDEAMKIGDKIYELQDCYDQKERFELIKDHLSQYSKEKNNKKRSLFL